MPRASEAGRTDENDPKRRSGGPKSRTAASCDLMLAKRLIPCEAGFTLPVTHHIRHWIFAYSRKSSLCAGTEEILPRMWHDLAPVPGRRMPLEPRADVRAKKPLDKEKHHDARVGNC
jgi:hypothetical protein